MPKIAYELKLFNEGIASHPDPEDLTINSATFSKGLDVNASAGTMCPRNKKITGRILDFPCTTGHVMEDHKTGTGQNPDHYFIYFTPAQGANEQITLEARIGYIIDWYGATTLED